MHYLVTYDISDSRIRERVSRICLDYGLLRFQKSAFIGLLSRPTFNDMKRSLGELKIEDADDIRFILLCTRCFGVAEQQNHRSFPELPRVIMT